MDFLRALEAGSLRSTCQQGWCLRRPLFLAWRRSSSPCVCLCPNLFLWQHQSCCISSCPGCDLIACLKTLSPNKVTCWGIRGSDFKKTRILEGWGCIQPMTEDSRAKGESSSRISFPFPSQRPRWVRANGIMGFGWFCDSGDTWLQREQWAMAELRMSLGLGHTSFRLHFPRLICSQNARNNFGSLSAQASPKITLKN